MRILLVVPWDEERGGVVTVAENLARELQARAHTVLFFHPSRTVILKTKTKKLGWPAGLLRLCVPFAEPRRIVSAIAFPFLFPFILPQLIWFVHRQRIGVINLHYAIDNFFYFAICRWVLPIRLVTSLHGSDAFSEDGAPKQKYSFVFRLLLRVSDLIVLPSRTYRERLFNVFPALNKKTIFIHNGVDPSQFSYRKLRDEFAKRRYILCVAHLKAVKGIDNLLRAAEPLLAADPSLDLIVVGDGPKRETLKALALSLRIQRQTRFVGAMQASEVAELLHGCEVFVLPSRAESFGLVVAEALACKKPVVATAVGGIPEIIEHGKNGLLVEPDNPGALADALRRVLTNDDLKRTLGENGYCRVIQHFTVDCTAGRYESAFASLLRS